MMKYHLCITILYFNYLNLTDFLHQNIKVMFLIFLASFNDELLI